MSLPERFARHLGALGLAPGGALVAVSGGPDSVALLDLLVATRAQHALDPIVAHVDHGIHPESATVAERVRRLAEGYGLPFHTIRLGLGPATSESLARARRYAWLERLRTAEGARWILTGHHADDQAETVLMRVLEGSGPAGLAAMAAVNGPLVRPLLPFRRAELGRYLQEDRPALAAVVWADPANAEPRHLRSWVRGRVLPLLRERLPRVDERLLRVAAQARQDRAAWDAVLELLPGLDFRIECDGVSVAAPRLGDYDSALAVAVLRAVARRAGIVLGPRRAERVRRLIRRGRSGAVEPLGGGAVAELAFGRLGLRGAGGTADAALVLEGAEGSAVWGTWRLDWRREPAPARQPRTGPVAWFATPPVETALEVRPWRAGDRIRPLGGTGRRLVVRCFQDAKVPRSRRAGWPVLVAAGIVPGDETNAVVWVPGVCRSDRLVPPTATEALRVDVTNA